MIKQLNIQKEGTLPPKFRHLDRLNIPNKITFGDGINLVVGPNGSGKTTLLSMLKMYTLSESGITCPFHLLGNNSVLKYTDYFKGDRNKHSKRQKPYDRIKLLNDYTLKTLYLDVEYKDGKELMETTYGIKKLISRNKSSHGGQVLIELSKVFYTLKENLDNDDFWSFDLSSLNEGTFNSFYKNLTATLTTHLSNNHVVVLKKPTIIMDEPDRHLDFRNLQYLIELVNKYSEHFQFIMSVHSPVAIASFKSSCKYIDLEKNYHSEVLDYVKNLSVRV